MAGSPSPDDRQPRLRPLAADECPESVSDIVRVAKERAAGSRNIFATLAYHPQLLRRFVPFAGKLLNESAFPAALRELAILRTAHRCGSPYEWAAHTRIGAAAGLTVDDIAGCAGESAPPRWPSDWQAVFAAVDQLLDRRDIDDVTWSQLAGTLTTEQLIELPFLVGSYAMLAGFLNVFRVEPD